MYDVITSILKCNYFKIKRAKKSQVYFLISELKKYCFIYDCRQLLYMYISPIQLEDYILSIKYQQLIFQ